MTHLSQVEQERAKMLLETAYQSGLRNEPYATLVIPKGVPHSLHSAYRQLYEAAHALGVSVREAEAEE